MAGPRAKIPGLSPEANDYILEIVNQAVAEGPSKKITLQTDNYFARFNDVIRAAPQNVQLTIFLPAPSVQNQGGSVTIYVQNVSAPTVVVPKGGLVNGASSFVLPAVGMYEFENDSKNWFTNVVAGLGGAGVAIRAGTNVVSTGTVNFSSANGLSFGLTGSTLTGSYTVPTVFNSGLLNITDSAFSVNASRLAFTNTGNVSFSLSTAASGATLGAVVATSLTNIKVSAGTSSANLSALTFLDSNNLSWGLNGSTITAQPFQLYSQVGGNSVNATRLAFSNASNVFFGLSTNASGGTITASASVVATNMTISAGASSAGLSSLVFNNSNGLAFGLNGSTITGSYTVPAVVNSGLLNVTDSAVSQNVSRLQFSNLNGLTLGLATGGSIATLTGSYTVPTVVNSGLLNVSNSVSSVNASRMVFSNSNNVSWSLATAGSIATVIAQPFMFVSGSASNNVTALHFANNASASFLMSTAASAATFAVSVAPSSGGSASPPPGLVLSATTHALEVVTDAASSTTVVASFEDLSSGSLTPGSQSPAAITTATTTTVVSAPGASTQRTITNLTITLQGATAQTITVQKDVSGNNFVVFGPVTILQNERIEFTSDQGWRLFNSSGAEVIPGSAVGDDFTSLARADADADTTTSLVVTPQFNWSRNRVARHFTADDFGPGLALQPGGAMRFYKIPGEVDHPGIVRCIVPLGASGYVHMSTNPTDAVWDPATLLGFRVILNMRTVNLVSDYNINIGFGSDLSETSLLAILGSDGVFAFAAGTNWQARTRAASTSTAIAGGASFVIGDWAMIEMYRSGSTWELFVNGVSGGTSSSNIPTALLNFGFRVYDNAGGAVDFVADIDSLTIFTDDLGQRWT